MTNKFKQQFLEQGHFDMLIEDMAYHVGLAFELDEEQVLSIIDKMYDKHKLADLYFNTFNAFFGGEERLKQYMEMELEAREAADNFYKRANECITEELNIFLPEEEQLVVEKEVLH